MGTPLRPIIPKTSEGVKKNHPPQRGRIFVETVGGGTAPQRGAICFLRSGQIVQLKDLGQSGTRDIAPRWGAPLQSPVSTNMPPRWGGCFFSSEGVGIVDFVNLKESLIQTKKNSDPRQFRLQFVLESAISWRFIYKTNLRDQLVVLHREISTTNYSTSPQQRQRIVTHLTFRCRRVSFKPIHPVPKQFESRAIPHDRIKRRQQPHRIVDNGFRGIFSSRPIPIHTVDLG